MSAYGFWQFVAKVLLKPPFWVTVEGAELIPKSGPVVLVPNHVSFLDPPFVGISCPRPIRFMARSSLANSRVLGWWMRQVGVVLIDRDAPARTTFGESVKILESGSVMAVFAEGTRSRDGRLAEFKKGVLKLLDKTGAIAVPTGIIGGFEAWPRHRKLPRPHRCRVRFGSPLTAAEVCAPGGLERLRAAVAALSGQELAPIGETPAAANGGPPVARSLNADSPPAGVQQAEPTSRDSASTG